jgi:putative PIN family toxin of toxin-antitoxin system
MRAVVDVNVFISAFLSRTGAPASVILAWLNGDFEMIISPKLLAELERALGYRKFKNRILPSEVNELVALVRSESIIEEDSEDLATIRSADPGDDYLIALALTTRSILVSGDSHLLVLADKVPVYTPATFLERLSTSNW